jgi:hypothetical protein
MKTLILTENQIRRVIDNIINEQKSNTSVFSVNFQNAFGSGQYNFTPEYKNIVNDSVEKIDQFIKNKKITNFKLVITPGESQVPNPKDFSEKGSLAKKRAEVLAGYLNIVLPKLGIETNVEIANPVIGKTEWSSSEDRNDPKYTKEQFVNVSVVLTADTPVEVEKRRNVEVVDTVKMYNPQGNLSGIGFVMEISEIYFDPNYGYKPLKPTYYELEIFPSDIRYYTTTVRQNINGLEDAIEKYKKMYKTNTVRRGTTKDNNYSPEGIAQMKRQNLFTLD